MTQSTTTTTLTKLMESPMDGDIYRSVFTNALYRNRDGRTESAAHVDGPWEECSVINPWWLEEGMSMGNFVRHDPIKQSRELSAVDWLNAPSAVVLAVHAAYVAAMAAEEKS